MNGKIVLITGANAGMGLATTIEIAKKGATVIMMCRNKQRGEEALKTAIEQSGSTNIKMMICDLGSLESIHSFINQFKEKYNHLDILINNAGVMTLKREVTRDGFEMQLGVNHLGHFLLTNLLIALLKNAEEARIINVSSGAHKVGKIHFQDPFLTKRFGLMKGYAQSKLANILFTKELSRKLKNTNITVNALHPGAVATSIGVNRKTGFGKSFMKLMKLFFLSPEEGASTAIYLATNDEVRHITGEYFYKKKISLVSKAALDGDLSKRLWTWSEQQVSIYPQK
ncbi:SDR family oxidoreductase [Chengkuizengella axinellae]|uniref:SDR family oxidoreductase n=1 Tax=Chengkuizengella axinellae TaxID=3064388 RepID=A0ABT9IT61_9BACL|nr:SDR family oxidoreductase [Chengkuizengella sp. 2205SS18-9]MDP5272544.1 SDR family oxidoreductase [Chengkuizengella sp. 2205SS18-9]